MADRKAVNKYYPPDWDPSKGSINKYVGSHPLRHRAKKIYQGIIVIRFAIPFNVWCSGCNGHVGAGVRYNAEKSKVGMHLDIPIYEFRMKCRSCDNLFVLRTDPSNVTYVIISGARKQAQTTYTQATELDNVVIDDEQRKRRQADAMYRLEKKLEDKNLGKSEQPNLQKLIEWRQRWEDNYKSNSIIRGQFRERRKGIESSRKKDRDLLKKLSIRLPLVKSNESDKMIAKSIYVDSFPDRLARSEIDQRKAYLAAPIIPSSRTRKRTYKVDQR